VGGGWGGWGGGGGLGGFLGFLGVCWGVFCWLGLLGLLVGVFVLGCRWVLVGWGFFGCGLFFLGG